MKKVEKFLAGIIIVGLVGTFSYVIQMVNTSMDVFASEPNEVIEIADRERDYFEVEEKSTSKDSVEIEKEEEVEQEEEAVEESSDVVTVSSEEKENEEPTSDPVEKKKEVTVTTNESTETASIPFETVYKEDSSIEKGKEVIEQEGVQGKKTITYKERYEDGKVVSKEVVSTTVTKSPVNQIVIRGTKTTPQAMSVLDNSILSKNGNTYTYTDSGEVVVTVKTNGEKVTSISFDGLGYYGYDYITEQLLVNEHGEKEGKKLYGQYQQQKRNIEAAIRAGANAVGGGDALYKEILNGGANQNVYTKNF